MRKTEVDVEKAAEELEALYRAELLDLLQKVASQKFKNDQIIQAIIATKIHSLKEPTSPLNVEIRIQIEEPGSNKTWKEANTINRRIR